MDLTKIDELDERQKALDAERAIARKEVLKEIRFLISRIDAQPDELGFSVGRGSSRRNKKPKKQQEVASEQTAVEQAQHGF